MNQTCQHCGGSIVRNAYRVTSEEAGITLLDMIVCSPCFEEAKRLILMQRKSMLKANIPQLETGGVAQLLDSALIEAPWLSSVLQAKPPQISYISRTVTQPETLTPVCFWTRHMQLSEGLTKTMPNVHFLS